MPRQGHKAERLLHNYVPILFGVDDDDGDEDYEIDCGFSHFFAISCTLDDVENGDDYKIDIFTTTLIDKYVTILETLLKRSLVPRMVMVMTLTMKITSQSYSCFPPGPVVILYKSQV